MPDESLNLSAAGVPRMALDRKEAAKALGIGIRLLWEMTNRNEIPHFRLGKRVLYSVAALERWMAQRAEGGHHAKQ